MFKILLILVASYLLYYSINEYISPNYGDILIINNDTHIILPNHMAKLYLNKSLINCLIKVNNITNNSEIIIYPYPMPTSYFSDKFSRVFKINYYNPIEISVHNKYSIKNNGYDNIIMNCY